jgi:hypothetical protein
VATSQETPSRRVHNEKYDRKTIAIDLNNKTILCIIHFITSNHCNQPRKKKRKSTKFVQIDKYRKERYTIVIVNDINQHTRSRTTWLDVWPCRCEINSLSSEIRVG